MIFPFSQIIGEEYRSGTLTIKLRRHVKTGKLRNTFTLWVSKEKPHRPIRYETEGFDLLLLGYYDHYYLDYITFSDWYFDYTVMEVPKGMEIFNIRNKFYYLCDKFWDFASHQNIVSQPLPQTSTTTLTQFRMFTILII